MLLMLPMALLGGAFGPDPVPAFGPGPLEMQMECLHQVRGGAEIMPLFRLDQTSADKSWTTDLGLGTPAGVVMKKSVKLFTF